jgi:uncharacterized protein YjbJ (UPF0337 family)
VNEQYVKGAADKVAGKIKEFAGLVTGNKKLETKGKVDQVGGNPVTAYLFTLSSLDSLTDRLLAGLQGERLWRSRWASSLICCNR